MADPTAPLATALPPLPPNIGAIAGPTLLGFMLAYAFFSALSLQVYEYYAAFPDDQILYKVVVYGLFCVQITQTILFSFDAWRMFATGYGNVLELLNVGFIWFAVPITTSIVSMVVQIFFAYRLFLLSRSWLLSGLITSISLTQGVSGIVAGVQAYRSGDLSKIPTAAFRGTLVWLSGSALCDVTIAISMIYFLSSRNTGFKETRSIIRRLVLLTVETGTFTALVAIVTIIVFAAFPHETYYTCPGLTIANCYSISAVVILNNRTNFRKGNTSGGSRSGDMAMTSQPVWNNNNINNIRTGAKEMQTGIRIQQEQWTDSVDIGTSKVGIESHQQYDSREIKLQV